jgi:tRNA threonylcarbamoyladenosine biosynthesis protein TsaB
MLELSIDTASEMASIALSRGGQVIAEKSWLCQRNHTVELLPAIDELFSNAGVARGDLTAVFVSTGPGMYTGLRVGIATAKGLARAASLPLVGVGRLELDAHSHAAFDGDVIAIHRAGRGELAWAAYRHGHEIAAPSLAKPVELAGFVSERTIFTGEIDDILATTLRDALGDLAAFPPPPTTGRAAALAHLGHARLIAGGTHEPALLVPIYLRPPAIGPQTAP